jgi:hypothetical protein
VHHLLDCSLATSGQVAQTGTDEDPLQIGGPHCPTSVQGVTLGIGSYMDLGFTNACVAVPAVQQPLFDGPVSDTGPTSSTCPSTPSGGAWYQPGYWQCSGNNQPTIHVDHTFAKGIYHIGHNPNCNLPSCADVMIDQHSGTVGPDPSAQNCVSGSFDIELCGVTFWLDSNATISIANGERVAITPYVPANGGVGNDGRFPIYAPLGTTGQVVSETNTNTFLAMAGTTYLPGGTFNVGQNAFVYVQGQVIVNQWAVQSGNHPNPDIQWDATRMASLKEILRIVE